jgi:hypothetical protein
MAIIALEIQARQTLAGGREFGAVGPYLQLDSTAHFAVDPGHPDNRGITDLDPATRDDDGRVGFAADMRILAPEDPRRSNHRLLFDVANRGDRLAPVMFNRVPPPIIPSVPLDRGDGFLCTMATLQCGAVGSMTPRQSGSLALTCARVSLPASGYDCVQDKWERTDDR